MPQYTCVSAHSPVSTYPCIMGIAKRRCSLKGLDPGQALEQGSDHVSLSLAAAPDWPSHLSKDRGERACPGTPSPSPRSLYCHRQGGWQGQEALTAQTTPRGKARKEGHLPGVWEAGTGQVTQPASAKEVCQRDRPAQWTLYLKGFAKPPPS